MKPISAYSLYHSTGINTHWNYAPVYKDFDKALACFKSLGIKLFRDCCYEPATVDVWKKVCAETGAKAVGYMQQGQQEFTEHSYLNTTALYKAGLLYAVEGGNENDSGYSTGDWLDEKGKKIYTSNSIPALKTFQGKVYKDWHGKLLVINSSVGAGWYTNGVFDPKGDYDNLGDMSAVADMGNGHAYATNMETPSAALKHIGDLAQISVLGKPVAHTEMGWHTTPAKLDTTNMGVPEDIQDIYLMQTLLSFYPDYPLLCIFELLDQKTGSANFEDNFGVFRSDYSEKPVAGSIRNLMALLATAKDVPLVDLDIQFSGLLPSHKYKLLQFDTNDYKLAIWREEPLHDSVKKLDLRTGKVDMVNANGTTIPVSNMPVIYAVPKSLPQTKPQPTYTIAQFQAALDALKGQTV